MTKDQLRKEYKMRRLALSLTDKATWDQCIFEKLKELDWNSVRYVHVYLTLEKFSEPDTNTFIQWIRVTYPNIKLVVSKSNFDTGTMTNFLLNDYTILAVNEWGILEPEGGAVVAEEMLDVVLVPLLVVDYNGNRVGYGKGFYDRFLSKCRADVKSYGISYFEPVESIDDVSEWDIKLSGCITPTATYYFK